MNFLSPKAAADSVSPNRNYLARIKPFTRALENTIAPETSAHDESAIPDSSAPEEIPESILVIEPKASLGRSGREAIPDYIKETISVLAQHDTKQVDIAEAFDVSQSTVSNFANGLDNNRRPDENLKRVAANTREDIEQEALKKTMMTLGLLNESDVITLGAKDKSIVAQNLSRVAANLRGNTLVQDNRVQMIIHAPPVRQDCHYPEIEV